MKYRKIMITSNINESPKDDNTTASKGLLITVVEVT